MREVQLVHPRCRVVQHLLLRSGRKTGDRLAMRGSQLAGGPPRSLALASTP